MCPSGPFPCPFPGHQALGPQLRALTSGSRGPSGPPKSTFVLSSVSAASAPMTKSVSVPDGFTCYSFSQFLAAPPALASFCLRSRPLKACGSPTGAALCLGSCFWISPGWDEWFPGQLPRLLCSWRPGGVRPCHHPPLARVGPWGCGLHLGPCPGVCLLKQDCPHRGGSCHSHLQSETGQVSFHDQLSTCHFIGHEENLLLGILLPG